MAYAPLVGRITERQFEAASREYRRRQELGEKHPRVVVARDVPVEMWQRVAAWGKVEAIYSADGSTVWVEFMGPPGRSHAAVVAEVSVQMVIYARANNDVLIPGGGAMVLVFANGEQRERAPDTALRPIVSLAGDDPVEPRLIVEVDFGFYSLPDAQRCCRQYFEALPLLRAVLLIKVYGPLRNRSIPCVAILYRRDNMGNVMVDDVVSFGSAPLSPLLDGLIEQRVNAPARRDLPLVQIHRVGGNFPVNPWVAGNNPFVRIPAVDLYHEAGLFGGGPAPVPARDLDIDLWRVFRTILASVEYQQ